MDRPTDLARRSLFASVARGDGALYDFICARRTVPMNRLMIAATRSGDGATYVVLAAAGLLAGGSGGRALVAAAAAAALASAIAYLVKRLIARPRPTRASALRVALVDPPDAWSFPSGHTATAVAAACAIGSAFGPAAFACGLAFSVVVAISRVYVGAHYPLDVLMGGALGAAVAAGLLDPVRDLVRLVC
jgi:undecaprenyl-diphosphatase